MGLFGGSRGWADALQVLGATLKDVSDPSGNALQGVAQMRQQRAQQAQQQALIAQLPQYMGQGGSAGGIPPALIAQLGLSGVKGADILATLRGQDMPNINVDTGSGEAYNQKDPGVIGRRFARPQVINGKIVDQGDPASMGMRIPQLGEGMGEGPGGVVQPVDGYLPTLARIEGAKAGAKVAVEAPYQFDTYKTPDGREVRAAKSTMAGQAFAGPTPAQTAYDTAAGADAATREKLLKDAVSADQKLLPLLDQTESLLASGKVISGAGADLRLQAERGLAAIGDKKAKERVTATELYQNITSRQVLPLVKQLGTGAGVTNTDREFVQAIVAGNIGLNQDTMKEVIRIARDQAAYNAQQLRGFKPPTSSGTRGASTSGQGYTVKAVRRAQ